MASKVFFLALNRVLEQLQPAITNVPCPPEPFPTAKLHISLLDLLLKGVIMVPRPTPNVFLFWLQGDVGIGTGAIAMAVADFLRVQGRLGAFLSYSHCPSELSSAASIVRAMAAQLSAFDVRFAEAVSAVLQKRPDIIKASLSFQMKKLLVDPLSLLKKQLALEGPIIIVLDALDECGSAAEFQEFCYAFAEHLPNLPSFLRIWVTGRKGGKIEDMIGVPYIPLDMSGMPVVYHANIVDTYFAGRLREIRGAPHCLSLDLPVDWPGEATLTDLSQISPGNLLWAMTVARFLNTDDPASRLAAILQERPNETVSALDSLYAVVLGSIGDWTDDKFVNDFQLVMGTLVVGNPLTAEIVDELLGKSISLHTQDIIQRLLCVLYQDAHGYIRFQHFAFHNFITDSARCGSSAKWLINKEDHIVRLAGNCLDYIQHNLRCQWEAMEPTTEEYTRELRRVTPMGLIQLPEYKVSSTLWYACIFWSVYAFQDPSGEFTKKDNRVLEFVTWDSETFKMWAAVVGKDFAEDVLRRIQAHQKGEHEPAPLEDDSDEEGGREKPFSFDGYNVQLWSRPVGGDSSASSVYHMQDDRSTASSEW